MAEDIRYAEVHIYVHINACTGYLYISHMHTHISFYIYPDRVDAISYYIVSPPISSSPLPSLYSTSPPSTSPLRGNISPSGPHVLSLTTAIVSSPTLSYSPTRSYSHSKIFPSPLQHSPRASYQVVSSENRGIVILQANPPKYVRPPAKPSLFPPFTKSRG
jgi:hypothetical protein